MLNILTLNLMQKAPGSSMRSRLNDIVEYISIMDERPEVFLIQEGCGGLVNLTFNSIRLLAKKLEKKLGKKFYYYSKSCSVWYVRPFADFKVGIISEHPILEKDYERLLTKFKLKESTTWKEWAIEFATNYVMFSKRPIVKAKINIPLMGDINFYSTHLGNYDLYVQSFMLRKYLEDLVIFGGDFNYLSDSQAYRLLNIKYIDCEIEGSTYGARNNPYCDYVGRNDYKIDYIFIGSEFKILETKIIFNGANGPFVSDHCGVYTRIK
ncbi:MAG: endonuclease/exonuclease/phosphatase family protein [Candidatus Shapirobacteria bacterium]